MLKILLNLNTVLTRSLSSVIDDCKSLRKQIRDKDRKQAVILRQFKSIIKQDYLSAEDKVDKIYELTEYYLDIYNIKEELDSPEKLI